jgi:hypothetical protein
VLNPAAFGPQRDEIVPLASHPPAPNVSASTKQTWNADEHQILFQEAHRERGA